MFPDKESMEKALESTTTFMDECDKAREEHERLITRKDDKLTKKKLYRHAMSYRWKSRFFGKFIRIGRLFTNYFINLRDRRTMKNVKALYAGLNQGFIITSNDKWRCPHCKFEASNSVERKEHFRYVEELDHPKKFLGAAGYTVYMCKGCGGLFWIMWGD